MTITLAVGSTILVASKYGPDVAITNITNSTDDSTDAVATVATGHGLAVGDYVEIKSGWGGIDMAVVRVSEVDLNEITLEKVITDDLLRYPPNGGEGSLRKIVEKQEITQAETLDMGGGEQQFTNTSTLKDFTEKQMPTVRSPETVTVGVYFDDQLAWWPIVEKASKTSTPIAMFFSWVNGSMTVINAFLSLTKAPKVASGKDPLRSTITGSSASESMNYAKLP